MPPRLPTVLISALALSLAACDLFSPQPVCTAEAYAAIALEVRDSVTNAHVGGGSLIVASDGSYADTASTSINRAIYGLAYERAGTYTVSVQKPGYQPWSRAGVQVTRGECHVNTVSLVARLQQ